MVTRWYRAPEVILNASEYSKPVDVWSVGCIFAELLGRTALFPGKTDKISVCNHKLIGEDYLDQVQRIIAVLGTPNADDMSYIGNESAIKYIKSLPKRTKQSFKALYPKANPVALDLLSKMLVFNPDRRITIQECLAHPYFEGLHNPEEEPVSAKIFDWGWDNFELSKDILQTKVHDEAAKFQSGK